MAAWFNRSRQTPPTVVKADSKIPAPQSAALPWLANLASLDPETGVDPPDYPPSLIIGFGQTGQIVLAQLKSRLLDRYRGRLPSNVRLLLIESPHSRDLGTLSLDERVVAPEQNNASINYASLAGKPYFDWMRVASTTPSERLAVRARFVLDHCQQRGQSNLYLGLRNALSSFRNETPHVYFVANLTEPESAPLWDVAFLLRYKAAAGSGGKLETERFTALLAVDKLAGNTLNRAGLFAALRELSRFSFKGTTLFEYPDEALSGVAEAALLDFCFLMDSASQGTISLDLSGEQPEEGVPRAISEALLALIDPHSAAIQQELLNDSNATAAVRHERRQTFVSSLGVASQNLPIEALRHAVEFRLLQNLFFGEPGHLDEGVVTQRSVQSFLTAQPALSDAHKKEIVQFLLGPGQNHHLSFEQIARAIDANAWRSSGGDWSPQLDPLFAASLAEWLTAQLNGTGPVVFGARSNRLAVAREKLDALGQLLDLAQRLANRPLSPSSPDGRLVQERIRYWSKISQQARQEIEAWFRVLVGDLNRFSRVDRLRPASQTAPALQQRISSDWEAWQAALKQPILGKVYAAALELSDKGIEWPFYTRHIRPELREAGSPPGESLERLASRVGWLCLAEGTELHIRLVVAGRQYDGRATASQNDRAGILYSREQLDAAYAELQKLASVYSRSLLTEKLSAHILPERTAGFLRTAREPLLPYDLSDYDGLRPQMNRYYLLAPEADWADKVRDLMEPHKPVLIERGLRNRSSKLDDLPQTATAISLHHQIALTVTQAYRLAEAGYTFQPQLQLFVPEQRAAIVENELNAIDKVPHLHPQFLGLLAIGNLAQLFLQAWIFGLLPVVGTDRYQVMPPIGSFESFELANRPVPLLEALERFAVELPCSHQIHMQHPLSPDNRIYYEKELRTTIKAKRGQLGSQRSQLLREVEKGVGKFIDTRSPDPRLESLATYIKFLIQEDRFGAFIET